MGIKQKRLDDWNNDPIYDIQGMPPIEIHTLARCRYCGSYKVIKRGGRDRLHKRKGQRYQCQACNKRFTGDLTTGHYPEKVEYMVLSYAVKGLHPGQISDLIREIAQGQSLSFNISHQTVCNIIKRNVRNLVEFENLLHDVSANDWEVDEVFQNFSSKKYVKVFNIIAIDSRYWLVSFVSKNRKVESAKKAIKLAASRAKCHPFTIRCDGLASYRGAIKDCLPKSKMDQQSKTENFGHINTLERLNNTSREVLQRHRYFRSIENLQKA